MKKWIIVVVLTVALVAAVVSYLFYGYSKANTVPLFAEHDVEFGISSQELTEQLGEPARVYEDGITPNTIYDYDCSLVNEEAKVTFYVNQAQGGLWRMEVLWELESNDAAQAMFERVGEQISKEYQYVPCFHCDRSENGNKEKNMTMRLEIFSRLWLCDIILSDNVVRAKCCIG